MRSKKFVIVYAVIVFLIVFVIAFNSVCSISQFEVIYDAASPQMVEASERIQDRLEEKYLRKSFLFFNTANVNTVVAEEGNGYLEVYSIEKSFPNKISVSVREKYEAYTFVQGGKYYVVGDDGTVLAIDTENRNNIEGRNVEISGIEFAEPEIGKKIAVVEQHQKAYLALKTFVKELNARDLRGNILSIVYGQDEGYGENWFESAWFIVETVEGVQIQIMDPDKNTQTKAELALKTYQKLGEAERMYGYIHVTDHYETGETTVSYSYKNPLDTSEELAA